ncbi:MAG TPA: MFS transporter [Vicinamibacterales bacterium]|nr:MFS transporter [Vicinamibacterales bacterium]
MRPNLPRPVWLLGWVSFFTDTASEMVYPLLPLFLTRVLGAGAMSLGVIEGVAEAANSVLKIVSGRIADATGRPRRLVLAGYGLSSAVRPLIAVAAAWSHVLAIRFADRLGKGIRGAPRDAMLAAFAPAEQRGRVFGFHRAMDHAGAVIGPLIAAVFLYFYPEQYRTLFALTIVPGLIVIAFVLAVPETRSAEVVGEPASGARAREAWLPPGALPSPLRRALAVIFLFGLGNASDAFLLLRLNDVGVAPFWIPLLWSALHVVKVASSVAGGELSDRFGRRELIGAGWLFYAAVYGAFALVDTTATLVGVFLAYGIYFGLTEGVEKAWVADLSPTATRGTAFGFYNAAIGVSALLASLVFGLIWTTISPQAAFLTGALLAVGATLLLYLLFSHEANSRHQ